MHPGKALLRCLAIATVSVLTVLIPLTTAVTHPIHHQLVAQFGAGGSEIRKRANDKPLRITNGCQEIIHPAVSTQAGSGPESNGFELQPGESRLLTVGSDWQGRVWGRTNCSFNAAGTGASNRGGLNGGGKACVTGDCNGILDCQVSGETPVTLAEFTLSSPSGQSFYDISLVDGYNLPLAIVVLAANSGDSAILDIPPNLTNPACIGTAALLASEQYNPYLSSTTSFLGTNSSFPLPFEGTQTFQQILRWCPWDLQLQPPLRPADGVYPYPDDTVQRPSFGPCYSACAKYNRPSDCCTQEYNSPEVCRPSMYSRSAKAICPDAYSYAYDDPTSTFIIPSGAGFEVVFCPGGRSTNILKTMSAELRRYSQVGYLARRSAAPDGGTFTHQNGSTPRHQPTRNSFWALVMALGTTIGVLDVFLL